MVGVVDRLRLIGPAGSNRVMAGELSRLARRAGLARDLVAPKKDGPGTLVYPFGPKLGALAATHHRTSTRVVWDLWESSAARLEPLYASLLSAVQADTRSLLGRDFRMSVEAHNVREFAAGERQVVGTVKNAIVDGLAARGLRARVAPRDAEVLFGVRLSDETVVVSLDLAGRPMNQRGYRDSIGRAPLKENLAAMLVMLARHDGRREPLVDPMGGTGTIAIEAACMSEGRPVFCAPRRPAAAELTYLAPHASSPEPLFADTRATVLTNELDPLVFETSRAQVQRAGVESQVRCTCGDFRDLDIDSLRSLVPGGRAATGGGLVLCNPPYGVRLDHLGERELDVLYEDLGRFCRQLPGWRAGFLVANALFEEAFTRGARVRPRIKKPLNNGALRGYFLLYDL